MDPITGLAALAGISLASMAALRLKKLKEEGFAPVPDSATQYPESVEQSQSRYNMFSGMVDPVNNPIVPVGSPSNVVARQTNTVNAALGTYSAEFAPDDKFNVVLKRFENKFKVRSDDSKSLYSAVKFCQDAAKQTNPFTTYNSDGTVNTQGAVSPDGHFRFDEICGICITNGVDENGNAFRGPQGMLVDPTHKDEATEEQRTKGWSYARMAPSIGTCTSAPEGPVFATNAKDLRRFNARQACLGSKSLGGPDNCALCYDSDDVYAPVPPDTEINPISILLRGVGNVRLKTKHGQRPRATLSDSSDLTLELQDLTEGDSFILEITPIEEDTTGTIVYGYMFAEKPSGGIFSMPLNLVMTVDDETGASPSKSGGFFNFSGLDVAKMRPGSGKTRMLLRGVIPFTFVQSNTFPAMDCLNGPYQKESASATAFSTDQPCFARGSRPGNYNAACLRARILDAGCTNAGELYKNPTVLNTDSTGAAQTLAQIYAALQRTAALDMVDPAETLKCSGRQIQTPCDSFILRQGTQKFADSLNSTNPTVQAQANQCLSFLYHNRGANETANPPRVGPTYTGMVNYRNNQQQVKNIYCLPDGALNPDTNASGKATLVRIADSGYNGKVGVDAIKQYLNDQLLLAIDTTKNANTDADRSAAIVNCFGKNLKALPEAASTSPNVIANPCGVVANFVRVLPSLSVADSFIEISQLVVINSEGRNVALGKSTTGTSPAWAPSLNAAKAIDGQMYAKMDNFYHSATAAKSSQFLLNLGGPTDITKIIYYTRGDNRSSHYRKNGIRLQLLDANQRVLNERLLNSSLVEEISYLQAGAASSCLSSLPAPASAVIPPGFASGLYVRFFEINDERPDLVPGNRGWGGKLGTWRAIGEVQFNDGNLPRADRCGVVIKGYYNAQGAETLHLATDSDDGIYLSFNGTQVLNNWTIHAPTRDTATPIRIAQAGQYPFELRFYEWGGGALCRLLYRLNDEATWRTNLTHRFVYKPTEVAQQDAEYTQRLAAAQQRIPVLYGPWIGSDMQAQRTFVLPNGEKVYAVFHDVYTKMVTESGVAKYYRGQLNQFLASNWNSYASAGNNYLLKFV